MKAMVATMKAIPVSQAVGMVLAHDITEIRQASSRAGHSKRGTSSAKRIFPPAAARQGTLFVLQVADDEMHENDAA